MKKIFSALLLLAATVLTTAVKAQTINGDLNHNGDLDVDDITLLINDYLTGENKEGDSHEYVDLGLSVMWATMNVGANAPEEYGDYFAWGETEPKDYYDWDTYKWCNGSPNTMTKYCVSSGNGIVDNKTVLDLEDDAAHVNWGGTWRMPTIDEMKELVEKCSWKGTIQNGANGYKVTGPSGNSIFLPAAGCREIDYFNYVGSHGSYWSSSLFSDHNSLACFVYFLSQGTYCSEDIRYFGKSVRAVCPLQAQTINGDLNHNGDLDVDDITLLINAYLTGENNEDDSHEYVDLGLSVKWATMNVGANAPEECGDYFAWGETESKTDYNWETFKWCNGTRDIMTKYCTSSDYGIVDNKTVLDLEDDAAHVNWGGTWRMPTIDEMDELVEKCSWEWTTQNGVNGEKVTGPNGNSIFLPAAGFYSGNKLVVLDEIGRYWSSTLYPYFSENASNLSFNSSGLDWGIGGFGVGRCVGQSVRAVCQ